MAIIRLIALSTQEAKQASKQAELFQGPDLEIHLLF